MDAVAAERNWELQRHMFIFGDIKSELLESFRASSQAFVYIEEGDETSYIPLDVANLSIFDDKMSGSFKVGDNFQCAIKANSKEKWFQIKAGRNFINLREPEKYFKREDGGIDFYIFVNFRGLAIVMTSPEPMSIDAARPKLKRVSKSIIGYDKYGMAAVKRGVK
ncbi:hypothetical protein [Pseudomonas putida]|uniref:Uncharacterized protein n=1 Tax=Pseudomonas putida TaxID=303 RepID=A0A8I1EAE6_PSEPU|nr:hypothetical protein [Pseudomonas putida]MBI6882809.1 hypothetical protein [Pseudomonas putida]